MKVLGVGGWENPAGSWPVSVVLNCVLEAHAWNAG